jgi:hypothetical protein
MGTSLALVMVFVIIAVEFVTLFVIFPPVVPETAKEPCFMSACTQPVLVFNYYGSISFHCFDIGIMYGACNGFQMVASAGRFSTYCGHLPA